LPMRASVETRASLRDVIVILHKDRPGLIWRASEIYGPVRKKPANEVGEEKRELAG
jgi:hypothetical protein